MTIAIPEDKVSATTSGQAQDALEAESTTLVEEDLLVEDVSIDGMCGVY